MCTDDDYDDDDDDDRGGDENDSSHNAIAQMPLDEMKPFYGILNFSFVITHTFRWRQDSGAQSIRLFGSTIHHTDTGISFFSVFLLKCKSTAKSSSKSRIIMN